MVKTWQFSLLDRSGKILSYGSDSTTPKSSSLSARESEYSSTSPSDVTIACGDHDGSGRDEKGNNIASLHEAVKTLRNEVQELQAKHEVQFMTFASKFIELDEGLFVYVRQPICP